MARLTKIDLARQSREYQDDLLILSGSTQINQKLIVNETWIDPTVISGTTNIGDVLTWDGSKILLKTVSGGTSGIYNLNSPSTVTVGGLPAGSAIAGLGYDVIFQEILCPYLPPYFSVFNITGASTAVEVGTVFSGVKSFQWAYSDPSKVNSNTTIIKDGTNNVTLANNISNTSPASLNVGSIQYNSPNTNTWTIFSTNTQSTQFSANFNISWYYKIYYGISTNTTLTSSQALALSNNFLASSFPGTYNFNPTGYKYFVVPDIFPAPTATIGIKDSSTNLSIAMAGVAENYLLSQNGWNYQLISITNVLGVTANYRVYRTLNVLGGAIQIIVS